MVRYIYGISKKILDYMIDQTNKLIKHYHPKLDINTYKKADDDSHYDDMIDYTYQILIDKLKIPMSIMSEYLVVIISER